MKTQHHDVTFESDGSPVQGRIVANEAARRGVLFVHGWDSDQQHYEDLSDEVAAGGCTCLTFDLRGHGESDDEPTNVSRADNLCDVLAAYDTLARWPGMDTGAIGVVGTSYGGYLAAIAAALRPLQWLALRVPALYPDAQWDVPKTALDRRVIQAYRSAVRPPGDNRALAACRAFRGDVLVVESAEDEVIPRPTIQSFLQAFEQPRSLVHHVLAGADHELSRPVSQEVYEALLLSWIDSVSRRT